MKKFAACVVGLVAAGLLLAGPAAEPVKLTGWFACEKCTAPRVGKGDLRPSNPECARSCIKAGSAAVFISEQGRELYKVSNAALVDENLGFHIEVNGSLDRGAKLISIDAVKQLDSQGASCARPRKQVKR